MSHLNCDCPEEHELIDLDSFDLSFLVMTGRIKMVTTEEAFINMIKAIKEVILWGPSAKLLSHVLMKAWKSESQALTKQLDAAFKFTSDDVIIDYSKIERAFYNNRNLGKRFWKSAEKKVIAVLDLTYDKAGQHFERRRREALKQVTGQTLVWKDYLVNAGTDHIKEFVEEFPMQVLHPEVRRMAQLAESQRQARLIDLANVKKRIENTQNLINVRSSYVSDIQAGKLWAHTGIVQASMRNVTTYQIVAHIDRVTCPVCLRMDGKTGSVVKVMDKVVSGNLMDPFPRVADIDNVGPRTIHEKGLTPPFHPRCRCDLQFLYTTSVSSRQDGQALRAPRPITPRLVTPQTTTSVAEFTPAKTLKEAEDWAKKNIIGLKKVNFTGFSIEQTNSVLSEINLLQNKYGRLGSFEEIKVMPKTFGMAGRMNRGKVLEIRQDMTDEILIRLTDAAIDKSKLGLAGLVDHEIGHAMTPNIFHVSGGRTGFTEFGKRLDVFFETNKVRIGKDLTPYAASIRHEFVAEAFAFREAGNAPNWAMKWLKRENIGG